MNIATPAQREAVDRIRAELFTVEVEIDRIENLPIPVAEAGARFRESLDDRLRAATIGLSYFNLPGGAPRVDDLGATLAAVMLLGEPDRLDKAAKAALAKLARERTDGDGVSAAEREKLLEPLRSRRRELLLDEERAILALEAVGATVARRRVEPEILLEAWS